MHLEKNVMDASEVLEWLEYFEGNLNPSDLLGHFKMQQIVVRKTAMLTTCNTKNRLRLWGAGDILNMFSL